MNLKFRPVMLAAIAWLVASTVLFCLPGKVLPAAGWMDALKIDKWVHTGIFFLLFVLWSFALSLKVGKHLLWLFLALFSYGCIIEWVQDRFIINRSFDIYDIVADTAGALIGLVFIRYIKK
jgi:Fe2+ transport system protein B